MVRLRIHARSITIKTVARQKALASARSETDILDRIGEPRRRKRRIGRCGTGGSSPRF